MKVTRFVEHTCGISERVTGFMAHLRGNGIDVGVSESATALQAMLYVDLSSSTDMRLACKAVCAVNAESYSQFDELFDAYWMNGGRERRGVQETPTHNPVSESHKSAHQNFTDSAESNQTSNELDQPDHDKDTQHDAAHSGDGKLVASGTRNIEKVDLRELMTPEALRKAEQVAVNLARAIRDKRSRRRRAAHCGSALNLRKVMRASISTGGDPLSLYRQHRPDRPVKVVALLDVSGSMMVYSRVFLAFLKGLVSHDQHTDAYLFHTSLVHVSDVMRDADTLRAVNRLSLMAQGFGGGTRIGMNLQRFNQQYAARTVNSRSVVIIFSDGYDTDPPEIIAAALARLRRRGCRILWLNPLKGWKDYSPAAQAMSAALPYLDLFASANTLESLAALEPHLVRL